MFRFLHAVNSFVWGVPAFVLIAGAGLYLTVRSDFAQIRMFPAALKSFLKPLVGADDAIARSKRKALYTALAATVGTGNLAGVAGAIAMGGPGAVFWMWIFGILGMVTKFAEATLAVAHRKIDQNGKPIGGPMYMILNTMHHKWHFLAYCYCFFGVVASFGIGNGTQINTVIGGMNSALSTFDLNGNVVLNLLVGCILAVAVYFILSRGSDGIGAVAERLVPFAALFYVVLCFAALFICRGAIPGALHSIIKGAFSPKAATGGIIGSFFISLRVGAARGVFTNEAGMGTASMAHVTAIVKHPVDQGLMGIIEVFIDTIVICTLTALVILCSGIPINYGNDMGISLTMQAFVDVFGQWVSVYISIALCLFAFATILGWGLYGMQCARFLFGDGSIKYFVLLQTVMVVISSFARTDTLWLLAEIINGLMAIPNLIVLAKLAPEFNQILLQYKYRHPPKRVPQS